jgi:hypothetical protein
MISSYAFYRPTDTLYNPVYDSYWAMFVFSQNSKSSENLTRSICFSTSHIRTKAPVETAVNENHKFKIATIEQDVRDLLLSWNYKEIATHPYHSVSHSYYEPKEAL